MDPSPSRVSVVSWLAINWHVSTEQNPDCFTRKQPVLVVCIIVSASIE